MSTKITIIEGGPAIIQSEDVVTLNGELTSKKIALCRCGNSANKIYCDGSHSKKDGIKQELVDELKPNNNNW